MKSARANILGWVLIPVTLAMIATLALTSALLMQNLSTQIDQQLSQEAEELRLLSERAIDPVSGQPYARAQDLLELYIRRAAPDKDEVLFVLVNGVVSERTTGELDIRLDQDLEFTNFVTSLDTPYLGDYSVDGEDVRFVAIPVSATEDTGFMVAAIVLEPRIDSIRATTAQLALLMLIALAAASLVGWVIAGRILKPISDLGSMTRRVRDGTSAERLGGFNSESEIGGIANDFNRMLDRTAEAFDSQKRFVDDAGHELKTPLTIIRGHLDLIRANPSEEKNSMPIIEDEVLRMTRIVKDLQTLTKSSKPSFIQLAKVIPSEVVDEVFVKAAALADRKWSIQLSESPVLHLDRQRLVQALVQLVDNAIKHTKSNGPIEIGCRLTSEFCEFYVGDSGPGIPKESRNQVLERFVRGNWTAEDTEGSGLGLAIVTAIAQGHGGEVFINSSNLGGAEVGLRVRLEKLKNAGKE
jgi:two-component system, OmpR family, sensor kinase